MIISEILNLLGRVVDILLSMIGLGNSGGIPAITIGPNNLRVFIKYSGSTIQVDLDSSWSIAKVKSIIAPKLNCAPEEIKIIFAGNELPDDFILQTCDVGQQSFLHAVKVQIRPTNNTDTDKATPSGLEAYTLTDDTSAANTNTTNADSSSHEPLLTEEEEPVPGSSQTLANRTRTFSANYEEASGGGGNITGDSILSDEMYDSLTEENSGVKSGQQQSRSDFFVLCSECADLKEGKLRVRCAKCLSGAFTVHRHPQGWTDVLVPKQIDGSCETEDCDGNFAQFFFKCTSHITKGEDDSSPPLPQIRRNPEEVPCLACGDPKELIFLFTCPNAHTTCVDCFKDYTLVKLNQREFVQDTSVGYTLGCPALCGDSLIKDPHHFKLLGKYQYDRYQRFGTEECLLQLGGVFCPQPDCGMGIIPADSNCDKIACLHGCEYVFCRKCLEGWHIGDCRQEGTSAPAEDCSSGGYRSTGFFVSEDRAAAAQWGDPSRRALRLSTKPCPNCRVPTERDGGCMHMECTKCKFQWCWVCQTTWNRECMGNHWFG